MRQHLHQVETENCFSGSDINAIVRWNGSFALRPGHFTDSAFWLAASALVQQALRDGVALGFNLAISTDENVRWMLRERWFYSSVTRGSFSMQVAMVQSSRSSITLATIRLPILRDSGFPSF